MQFPSFLLLLLISLTTQGLIQNSIAKPSNLHLLRDYKPFWKRDDEESSSTKVQNLINFPGREGEPECSIGDTLSSHDCNRALLALGTGIKGKVQFLKVADDSSTGTFGSCKVTVQSLDKRKIVVSKGRLENGPGYLNFMKQCHGHAGTIILGGGVYGMTIESTGCESDTS
ncbi:hypothetical protein CROQUDRAFT_60485 [Cronartium quercuum f. sp. fusiforme G11]|uniref:Uncharacterized protein n=1 Tax=Cronartium quercuum f. sp. fusiforme G11 TaxID=708437 RepID=A0A9P6NS22_9BASI|nr:hypothetical protein CROQUDRAFT_60485 [Cronartium quercuum f. sp. fusiforme G11]